MTDSNSNNNQRKEQVVFTTNPNQNHNSVSLYPIPLPPPNASPQEIDDYFNRVVDQMQTSEMNFIEEVIPRIQRLEAIVEEAVLKRTRQGEDDEEDRQRNFTNQSHHHSFRDG